MSDGSFDTECFFVAPIGPEDSDIRRRSDGVLNFIVARAAAELGLEAMRADNIASPGQINLQVIEHVLQARLVVADLTGLNPNVFYEIAVRHTTKLPIVLIAEKDTELPFDILQMRTIFFRHNDLAEADACRQAIVQQARDVFTSGIVDSPIATAIDLSSLAGGNAIDRSVAELVTTVEELARLQRDTREAVEQSLSIRTGSVRTENRALQDAISRLDDLRALVADEPESDVFMAVDQLSAPIDYLARNQRRHTPAPPLRRTDPPKRPSDGITE